MEKEKPKAQDPKVKNRKQSLKHRGHRRLPYFEVNQEVNQVNPSTKFYDPSHYTF